MYDWTGKNVVFVSGFSGIGYQMMQQLMQRQKLKTMGIMHRMENMEMMKKLQAENPSTKLVFMQVNLMDKMSMEQNMRKMGQMMGNIDVLINGEDVLLDKDIETTIGINLVKNLTVYRIEIYLTCLLLTDQHDLHDDDGDAVHGQDTDGSRRHGDEHVLGVRSGTSTCLCCLRCCQARRPGLHTLDG